MQMRRLGIGYSLVKWLMNALVAVQRQAMLLRVIQCLQGFTLQAAFSGWCAGVMHAKECRLR